MSQRDGFGSGFLAGALVGGVVGSLLAALVTTRTNNEWISEEEDSTNQKPKEPRKMPARRRPISATERENMEMEIARRSLEDKIAQLNATIDEVRQQLGNVNSSSLENK